MTVLAGLAVLPGIGLSQNFETKADRVLLVEANTGTVLLSRNADSPLPPASLAKLMTMEVVFDALKKGEITLDTQFPVSEHAWRTGGAPSHTTTMFAAIKSQIRVEDLIRGATIQLANDACIILAEGMEGSEEKFAERMTRRAAAIGLKNTFFSNPTGLPHPGNRTTISDLVRLAEYLKKTYPEYYRYYSEESFEWNGIFQRNKNPLIRLDSGVDGLGLGYSDGYGYAYVGSMQRDGRQLYLAFSGVASEKDRASEAEALFNWGMTAFKPRHMFDGGEVVGQANVYGGVQPTVALKVAKPLDLYVPVAESAGIRGKIDYKWPLKAPVDEGGEVASLQIISGDQVLGEVPLLAGQAVRRGSLESRAMDAAKSLIFFWM
ncbi:D-alanyl-D-alanine carboxypeptidase family protein [Rhizobium sp. NRK18]|uniref:D-alanyl-D-alanine carboxypeptidase family protein n=1 Tax=Rhizobium sp. NRK18 TaxID=2964667 RepID=UPI0021C3C5E1|nr:D-alanyl-D-alanine carboxypeptidase family protein [Rhizobium sp. NRK18]MCQ2004148.1 D-alanyl-D-alanine carboxypeptidase [Rhizobium sp. NRK18]